MGQTRNCEHCGKAFSPVSKIHAFCSDACRKAVRGSDYRKARAKALFRDSFTCTEPGCDATTSLECHHIKLLCQGGDHSLANLQTLCHTHHRSKHKSYKGVILSNEQRFKGWGRQSERYDNAA